MDPRALKLFDQHFEIHDDRFDYANVRGIRWQSFESVRTVYFIPTGTSYNFELSIEFASGRPLDLGVGALALPSWASTALDKRGFLELADKVQRLFGQTREFRLAPYKEQMDTQGFFEYDGKAFFADGSVQYKGRRRTLDLKARAKATGLRTELKLAPSGTLKANTAWDRDCFHAMLNEAYGGSASATSNGER